MFQRNMVREAVNTGKKSLRIITSQMYVHKSKIHVLNKLQNKMTTFSFVSHLSEDGHGRPQHIGGVPYVTIFIIFYCSVVVGMTASVV